MWSVFSLMAVLAKYSINNIMRVLVIEDELTLQQQIREHLEQNKYMVDTSSDGEDGLFNAMEFPIDVAIVDIGLPKLSGIEVIKKIRDAGKDLPILILTARGSWQDKVNGLEAGADDYLVKPFHIEELLARLKALLRRSVGSTNEVLHYPPIKIDTTSQKLHCDDNLVELTTFEYRTIEYLIRNAGEVLSKQKLNEYLYPHDEDTDSNVIEVMIGRLRKKIDPDNNIKPIETLRGRGYRFTLDKAMTE